jgi:small subunit ribosomal protein S20
MPNLKASIKDYRNSEKKKEQNLKMKRRYRTAIKEFKTNLDAENAENSKKYLAKSFKLLDKAAKTKLLKKNTASRKKSRLTKSFNKVFKKAAKNVKTAK